MLRAMMTSATRPIGRPISRPFLAGMGFGTGIRGRVFGSSVRFMMGPEVRLSVPSEEVEMRVKVRLEAESVSLPA